MTKAQDMLRKDDTLLLWKLDRLGHSVNIQVDLVSALQTQETHFKSLTDAIDTSTTSGQIFSRDDKSCPDGK